MKINNTNITGNTIYINLDSTYPIDTVYLDVIGKPLNEINKEGCKHDFTIQFKKESKQQIVIPISLAGTHDIIVTVVSSANKDVAFAYDAEHLYKLLVELLNTKCDECQLKTHKQRVLACIFRLQLFDYSQKANMLEDSINNYKDLIRVLENNDTKVSIDVCTKN